MIVLTDPDPKFHSRVSRTLPRPDAHDLDSLPELEQLLAQRAADIDVVLLGPNVPPDDALRVAERMQRAHPAVSFVVVADSMSSDLLQSAMRAGVRDILPAEFSAEQLTGAVVRAEELSRQIRDRTVPGGLDTNGDGSSRAEVITVFSSKGGVGKSFISSNLGVLLAQRTGEPVALVDLDLQFGDLAIMLQVFPARTMYDASQNLTNLDAAALRGYLSGHRTGVELLAAPFEPGLAETIPAESVTRILKMLRSIYRYVVIDTPAAFNEHVVAALDDSDHCVLITSLDVPAIKNVKLAMQTLHLLGFPRERTKLVLNRADSEVGLKVHEVEKTLQTKVEVSIPSGREVPLSINRGVPLVNEAPFSPVVLALAELADRIGAPTSTNSPDQSKRRRFRRKVG